MFAVVHSDPFFVIAVEVARVQRCIIAKAVIRQLT